MNSKAMQVKVQREKESSNGTMKENHNTDHIYAYSISLFLIYFIYFSSSFNVIIGDLYFIFSSFN